MKRVAHVGRVVVTNRGEPEAVILSMCEMASLSVKACAGLSSSPPETAEVSVTTINAAEAKCTPSETEALQGKRLLARSKDAKAARVGTNPIRSELAAMLAGASVSERVALEMGGVPARLALGLFDCLQIPAAEVHDLFGIPKASLQRRLAASDQVINGIAGQTIVGCADLLNVLDRLVAEFGSEDSAAHQEFDAGKWLGRWLREPHPALGGLRPAAYLQAPSGRIAVTRALGAAFSGAYQ